MLSLFGFGKRRKVKRSSKKSKAVRKPPARLLKICKKYHVKATKKVGGRRCYKSVAVLKRMCLKKARAMKKKMMKMMKRRKVSKRKSVKRKSHKRKSVHRKRRTNRMANDEEEGMSFGSRRRIPMFGRRSRFGANVVGTTTKNYTVDPKTGAKYDNRTGLTASPSLNDYKTAYDAFGEINTHAYDCLNSKGIPQITCAKNMRFGKRRGSAKVSKAKAMKAFRSFWKRHCKGRRSGFGNGGNPSLSASMGYEFCPNGMGGVLGANSTGLFPSPCVSSSSSGAKAAFGKRRRRRSATCDVRRRRRSAIGSYRRRSAAGGARRRSAAGRVRRSATGGVRRRRSAAGGVRRRRSAAGGVRRRSAAGGARRRCAV